MSNNENDSDTTLNFIIPRNKDFVKYFFRKIQLLHFETIAKNYLTAEKLKIINNLVSAYFDLAEVKAVNTEPCI